MSPKRSLWYRFIALALALVLIVPVLVACGKGNEETPTATATPIATAVPTVTPAATITPTGTPTPTSTSSGPVKIGGLSAWSGPMAMSGTYYADQMTQLVQKQVKDMGGILGGRELQLVKYDERGSTAEAQAGVDKLYYDGKVSALVWGGESGTEFDAVAAVADQRQILFVALGNVNGLEDLKFTVDATVQAPADRIDPADFINSVLKPQTVAFLASDDAQAHNYVSGIKPMIEASGAKTVYEQYFSPSVTDYSPYLTKIKYVKPDVLYMFSGANEPFVSIAKQIVELGGWDNIKFVATPSAESAKNFAGAQGWYLWTPWLPSLNYPGSVKFINDYQAMFKGMPSGNHVYYYNCLWTAIYAIELAGTDIDRVAIGQVARSGKLEWDSPMGHAHYAPDGSSGLGVVMAQIQNKKLVIATTPAATATP